MLFNTADPNEEVQPRTFFRYAINDPKPQSYSTLDRFYESLQYPIIYPHGSQCWGTNTDTIIGKDGKILTLMQWLRYMLVCSVLYLFLLCYCVFFLFTQKMLSHKIKNSLILMQVIIHQMILITTSYIHHVFITLVVCFLYGVLICVQD